MLKCITVIFLYLDCKILFWCSLQHYSSMDFRGFSVFLWGSVCSSDKAVSAGWSHTLLPPERGRGREREMGGREESSSFQRNWAKSSLRCQKEDSSEHASLPASLTHFIAVGRSLNWMWVDTRAELGVFADRRLATLTLKVVSSNPRSICEKWRRETSKSNSLL